MSPLGCAAMQFWIRFSFFFSFWPGAVGCRCNFPIFSACNVSSPVVQSQPLYKFQLLAFVCIFAMCYHTIQQETHSKTKLSFFFAIDFGFSSSSSTRISASKGNEVTDTDSVGLFATRAAVAMVVSEETKNNKKKKAETMTKGDEKETKVNCVDQKRKRNLNERHLLYIQ